MGKIESGFLKIFGFGLIGLAVYFLLQPNVSAATVSAAVGILLTFLARFSQFKRFKGWGFEAEMWEEKQQEAANLIDSLKKTATFTAREVMVQSIKSGRWGSGKRWEDHWKLFNELKAAQNGLLDDDAQREIRRSIDRWFLHDMVSREYGELRDIVGKQLEVIRKAIISKYGNPVSDISGFSKEMDSLSRLSKPADGLFELAGSRKFVESIEDWWADTTRRFADYDEKLEMPPEIRARLATYKALEQLPEMPVTKDLISAADRT